MSQLLEQAVAEARKLPTAEQDAIAALILEEIEDDRRWDEAFARSPEKLAALAARAEEQMQAGRCRAAGFDGWPNHRFERLGSQEVRSNGNDSRSSSRKLGIDDSFQSLR